MTLFAIIYFVTLTGCKSNGNSGLDKKVLNLPLIDLLLVDSSKMNTNETPKGKQTILIYFNPDCEHCEEQTKAILANMDILKEAQFYFITNQSLAMLSYFSEYHHLNKYANIKIGQDYSNYFRPTFKVREVPFIVIYDGNKRLKKIIPGAIEIKQLFEFLYN